MTDGVLIPKAQPASESIEIGPTFIGFLERVAPPEARADVQASAVAVLEATLAAGTGTAGLVVGRVQSGKTLSYEGVVALARDNGFALVVVISGISNPLLDQGVRRLREDLTAADADGWTFLEPSDRQQAADTVETALESLRDNWTDEDTPAAYKRTAVTFLLKNHQRINTFAAQCESLHLAGLRVLIIDDEADQASLNTLQAKGRKSTTYSSLLALRSAVPGHFYLQYTATPQAPLLVAIQDALSPSFVHVLEPGAAYVGGDTYFGRVSSLVTTIPEKDLDAADDPHGVPPSSLRSALQEFLIGAAHGVATGGRLKTRSMLVHPSRHTGAHATFVRWIKGMVRTMHDQYAHADDIDPVKLRAEFHTAWASLQSTSPDISSFADCWASLKFIFKNLNIIEMNATRGSTPVIKWDNTKSYILVGGQAIDRGFTVEGLTVTYMPRGAGTWTADTIQQRARFFGYKRSYLGLCRVYLETEVRLAFEQYVTHEQQMLESLRRIEAGEESLKDWRRRFLLDKKLKPTRASVIGIDTIHVQTVDRWIADRYPLRADAEPVDVLSDAANRILADVAWSTDQYGHRHGRTNVRRAVELLEALTPESALVEPNFQGLAIHLAVMADNDPDESVAVYWMRPGLHSHRTLGDGDAVQAFQGRTKSGAGYPGDREIYDPSARLTIQLHQLELVEKATAVSRGQVLTVAYRIPTTSATGWLIESGR